MILNVLLRTEDYRGDHGADVAVAYHVDPTESVGSMVERILTRPQKGEVIEIRLVVEQGEVPF